MQILAYFATLIKCIQKFKKQHYYGFQHLRLNICTWNFSCPPPFKIKLEPTIILHKLHYKRPNKSVKIIPIITNAIIEFLQGPFQTEEGLQEMVITYLAN